MQRCLMSGEKMRDAEELKAIDGMTYLASAPDGEIINSMILHNGKIYVSTNKHIYVLENDKRLSLWGDA